MYKLFVFNFILIAIDVAIVVFLRKKATGKKAKFICLLCSSVLTIAIHYSSLIYHIILDGTAMTYLSCNPNLLLPIYPCNVIIWCNLLFALIKKKTRVSEFLADFIFLFGIVAALVGLFANVDFIRNPTLLDYDVTKGILAHSFMLLNILLVPGLGYYKLNFKANTLHIIEAIVLMLFIGLYCNLLFSAIVSPETAYNVNSMFLIHSPFEAMPWLKFPVISVVAIIGYSLILGIISLIVSRKKKSR